MKLLVFVVSAVCIVQLQAVTTATEANKAKSVSSVGNSIPQTQKVEMILVQPHATQQGHVNLIPVQIIPRPVYIPQQQPHVMLILTHPSHVSQNQVYYVNPLQQLLNYFHSNPQARHQLIYGDRPQPQPTPQPYYGNHPLGSQTVAYHVIPNPGGYNQLMTYSPQPQYIHPAQPYSSLPIPIRSTPPLITGFENFTPEQQAQIKSQLGLHLGSSLSTAATIPSNTLATEPTQNLNSEEYMKEGKVLQTSGTAFAPSLVYRSQFTKGK